MNTLRATKSTTVRSDFVRNVTLAAGMDITPANARRAARGERQQKEIRKEATAKTLAKEALRIILFTTVMGRDKKRGAKGRVSTKAKERRRQVAKHAEVYITIVIARKEEKKRGGKEVIR